MRPPWEGAALASGRARRAGSRRGGTGTAASASAASSPGLRIRTASPRPPSLSSDFAHVGLGSATPKRLNLQLAGTSPGAVSAAQSGLVGFPDAVPADSIAAATVVAAILDANGRPVNGKTVSLTQGAGG